MLFDNNLGELTKVYLSVAMGSKQWPIVSTLTSDLLVEQKVSSACCARFLSLSKDAMSSRASSRWSPMASLFIVKVRIWTDAFLATVSSVCSILFSITLPRRENLVRFEVCPLFKSVSSILRLAPVPVLGAFGSSNVFTSFTSCSRSLLSSV